VERIAPTGFVLDRYHKRMASTLDWRVRDLVDLGADSGTIVMLSTAIRREGTATIRRSSDGGYVTIPYSRLPQQRGGSNPGTDPTVPPVDPVPPNPQPLFPSQSLFPTTLNLYPRSK
jgi:hypothetical protein